MRSLGLVLIGAASALRLADESAKNRPVAKVIGLLKDMQKQLESEGENDQEIYDKMVCWCKTNDGEKSQAIKEAEVKIQNLQASIERGTAKGAQLEQEIANHDKERLEEEQSLAQATKIREKEAAEFNEKNKDVLQAISAMKSAITVLSKHQKNSSGKINAGALAQTNEVVNHLFKKFGSGILAGVTRGDQLAVTSFLQADGVNDYSSQSGQIFGILQNMLDTFIADNKESMDEEASKAKAFQEFKQQKEESISLLQKQIDDKTDIKAQTEAKVGQDKEELADTRNSLGEDEKFLAMLKEKCAQTDEEWSNRQKERVNETAAVAKALEFLTSDEAHDLFSSTYNFVQTQKKDMRRVRASNVLKKFPKLSMLSAQVQLDAFTKVKAAIDKMVKDLSEQKGSEIKKRDSCVARFQENDMNTQKQTQKKENHEAAIEKLEQDIKVQEENIKDKNAQVAESLKQMKMAGEDRAKENSVFQKDVAEQRASYALLGKARQVLASFYEKNKASLAQIKAHEPAGPPPPAGFKKYEKSSGGNSVLQMIDQIVADTKALEAETVRDEAEQQKAYEEMVQDTNALVAKLRKAIANHKNNVASFKTDHVEQKQGLQDTNLQLTTLGEENKALHTECDFLMKNFDIRQEAFDQEIEALRQAKAILSGSDAGGE